MRINVVFLFIFLPFVVLAKAHVPKSIYDFKVAGLDGKTINFAKFKAEQAMAKTGGSKRARLSGFMKAQYEPVTISVDRSSFPSTLRSSMRALLIR